MAELAWTVSAANTGAMSSLRMPQSLAKRLGVDTAETVLHHELLEEQAASLGRMGAKLEAALVALRAHDGEGRAAVLQAAADAAWCFFVQREVIGLRDRAAVVEQYQIPREVLVRIGAR
jgi:hypothetical protein